MPEIGVSHLARLTTGPSVVASTSAGMYDRLDPDTVIPDHLSRAPSRAFWLRVVEELDDAGSRRADWWARTRAVVWQVATRTGADRVTSPRLGATWAVLAETSGVSRSTLADRLRWLQARGLLVVLTPGSTVRYRRGTASGLIDDGLGNLAAEYILTVPLEAFAALDDADIAELFPIEEAPPADDWRDVPWPAETLPVDLTRTPTSLSGVALSEESDASPGAGARRTPAIPRPQWSATATPGTKKEMLLACERLRAEDPMLRKLSALRLRSLLRRLFGAGATIRDVWHVLNHQPDGRAWTVSRDLYSVPGWVRWRVRAWLDNDGALKATLPSLRSAACAAAQLAEQKARRADFAARSAKSLGGPIPAQPRLSRAEALAPLTQSGSITSATNDYLAARATMEARLAERRTCA
ncbi:hypothetical protein [Streptosporangium sp. NPDC002524]|uniref:hypothetical protein n=1 Tax=Streptosporangium sp. NPDC002524 TaxID=3154537 RepID=UPI00331B6838